MKHYTKILKNLALAGLLTIPQSTNAQLSHTTLGVKAGLNTSRLSVEGVTDESNILGYQFGVFGRLGFCNRFAIQPEVLLNSKGTELKISNAFVDGGAIIHLNYVDVPLVGMFYLTRNINLQFGPYIAYLTDINVKNKSESNQDDFSDQLNKDNFKKNDYGFVAGAGIEFRALNIGVRYLQGLTTVGEPKDFYNQTGYDFPDAKNSAWQVYIGLSFF